LHVHADQRVWAAPAVCASAALAGAIETTLNGMGGRVK
jgi:hypothetical protein